MRQFGITRSGPRTTTLRVDGGCGTACVNGFNATLDAEWALAMAPGASLFTYQIPSLAFNFIVDGFNRVVSDDAVNIINIPFDACEVSIADLMLALQPIVAQGAAEGITFEARAAGNADVCGVPQLAVPVAPADLDTVTAVGASSTSVDQSGNLLAQTAYSLSNGGVSLLIPLPSWQAKTPGVHSGGRNVPDVVLPGEVDGTGPSIYYLGQWVGGAIFVNNAAFAGYLATVQQMYGYTTPIGNVASALYTTFNKYRYSGGLFTDITLGCNGSIGVVPICAKPGYDITSGLGSIQHGYALAKALGLGPIQPPSR